MGARIKVPRKRVGEFCRRNRIRRLSLFGSVLRDDFRPDSDVDVLVEFKQGARVELLTLAGMEIELRRILKRTVGMNTGRSLSPYYRDQVLAEAEVLYEQT